MKKQEKERGQVFGQKCIASLAKYDQDTQSLKTYQCSFIEDLNVYSATLPRQGSIVNGRLSEQTKWELGIEGRGSGSLPTQTKLKKLIKTPSVADSWTGNLKKKEYKMGNSGSLAQEVESGFMEKERMFPTPTTQETEHPQAELTKTGRRKTKDGKDSHSLNLADTVRMFPTPTTMDGTNQDAKKHAARIIQGKTTRVSGQPIQITLSHKIAMMELEKNPELVRQLLEEEMTKRTKLPEQKKFVNYLRKQTNPKELSKKTGIKKTTLEHWFRYDQTGFSHPSIKDWEKIKPHLKKIKFDKEMTYLEIIEWVEEKEMFPTPRTQMTRPVKVRKDRRNSNLEEVVAERMFPTPTSGMHKQDVNDQGEYAKRVQEKGHQVTLPAAVKLLPTPTANDYKGWSKGHKRAEDPTNRLDFAVEPDKGVGGTLNPNWVEWLMGFPIGFTDLEDSETQ